MFNLIFLFFVIVEINCGQPRSAFLNLDIMKRVPLGQYAKLLQPPLAFSHNQDSKTSESVINHKRIKPALPLAVRKLSSKRILMPRKYLQEINLQKSPDEESKFLIYVPEENSNNDLLVSPIVVQDLSTETSSENMLDVNKNMQIAYANSEIENDPKSDQHVQETHQKKHNPKPSNTKFKKEEKKTEKAGHQVTHKENSNKKYHAELEKHKVENAQHLKKEKFGFHDDKSGDNKEFDKGEGYEAGYHEEDDGHKISKYEEDGENDKGHASKGTHNIHKKDEYVKKIEFFDEYHEDSDEDENDDHEDDKDYKKEHLDKNHHRDAGNEHDVYAEHKSQEDAQEKKYNKGKHEAGGREKHHDHDHLHHDTKKIWKIIVTDK